MIKKIIYEDGSFLLRYDFEAWEYEGDPGYWKTVDATYEEVQKWNSTIPDIRQAL